MNATIGRLSNLYQHLAIRTSAIRNSESRIGRREDDVTPERTKELSRIYHREMDEANETLTVALCETYKNITGKQPSPRFAEEVANAIRYERI